MPHPTIALISAVHASIPPIRAAFAEVGEDAVLWNVIDDRLLEDATEQGGLTPSLRSRMERLIRHAVTEDAAAVLLTCSLYTPVAHELAAEVDIPVFGPDDGVFAAATTGGYERVVLVSSGAGPLDDSLRRFRAVAPDSVTVVGALAEDAAIAARSGDVEALTAAIVRAAEAHPEADAVVLGQYSLSPAAEAAAERLGIPVLAGPTFAVELLNRHLREETS